MFTRLFNTKVISIFLLFVVLFVTKSYSNESIDISIFKNRDNKTTKVPIDDYLRNNGIPICVSWGDYLDRIELTGNYDNSIDITVTDVNTNSVVIQEENIRMSNLKSDVKLDKKSKKNTGKYIFYFSPFVSELGQYEVTILSNGESILTFMVNIQECGG
jgi:hypothetical protein